MFTRNCPVCNKELIYKNKSSLKDATKKNRRCYNCRVVNRVGKNVKCSWCEVLLYRRPSQIKKRNNHFCSQECFCKFNSKYKSGKNHKLWKGGDKLSRILYRKMVNTRKFNNKQRAVSMLGTCCSNCKYYKCIDAIEFHHIDPKEKDIDVCKLLYKKWSIKLENEIRKCKLLCSNCHKEHHFYERQNKA